jgi:hypothetical protein
MASAGCKTEGTVSVGEDAASDASTHDTTTASDGSTTDSTEDDTASDTSIDTGSSDTDEPDTPPQCVCTPQDKRCTNGREQVCNANCQRWDVIRNCGPNEACSGDVCIDDSPDCTCSPGDRSCQNGHVAECQSDCRTWNQVQTCGANQTCQNASCVYAGGCSQPVQVVSNPSLSRGSGTFFIVDLDCQSVEVVLSPIVGPQQPYRSTLATWLGDFNQANDVALAFNTNYSVTGGNAISGAYVHTGTIFEHVYVVPGCSCPNCTPEDTLYSIAIDNSGRADNVTYNLNYDTSQCSSAYNWQMNAPIKAFASNGGIIPDSTRYLVTGVDIETGVPHHGGTPDPFTESIGSRNVMGVDRDENTLVIGMMTAGYRQATKNWMVNQGGVDGQIIVFDGGGSTKQYADYGGENFNREGSRLVPGIMGIRLR